jgi:hypothetical protein
MFVITGGVLPASARSDLWVALLAHHRTTQTGQSAKQSAVLDDATRLASGISTRRQQGAAVDGLQTAVIAAFGEAGARAVLMPLGPVDTRATAPHRDQGSRSWTATPAAEPSPGRGGATGPISAAGLCG